ncbi:MAG: class I SAM-dependent methyltransferase [Candidatus Bathyarchaeia archaeon]
MHSEMLTKRVGLSSENEVQIVYSTYVPAEETPVTEKQIAEAWDSVIDKWNSKYTEFGDSNRQYVIDPAIFQILGETKGLQILDAGCGNGYLCRLLAKKGAKMTGIDISRRAIEIAEIREKQAPLGIKYYVGSLCNLSMFKDQTFDFIISNLVLMDLQEIDKAIKELHRVLKTKGKLVFSIMHPCFSSSPVHGWEKKPVDSDRKEDWIYWKVDRYFDRAREEWRYFDFPPTYSFHRTLSDYIKALISNGFTITDFEEPVPSKRDMEEHHRELGNEYDRIPWFLVIGAVK